MLRDDTNHWLSRLLLRSWVWTFVQVKFRMPSCETSTPLYFLLAPKVMVDLCIDLSRIELWIHLSFHWTNCSLDKLNGDSMSNELLDSTGCSRREDDSGDNIEIAFAKIEDREQNGTNERKSYIVFNHLTKRIGTFPC